MEYTYRLRYVPTSSSYPWKVDICLDGVVVAKDRGTDSTKFGARWEGRRLVRHCRKFGTHEETAL